ncbi:hypothetical protein OIE62_14915 [Streptomyces scopuliridis]|uniref:Uncharacterized protein n=1 Tax=Streptomyces scopuliridis TaxID=452529 RepID=A0ACD4ZQ94_9ACTN|nr:hypothetical protein [Streptomyces scopuliridis]WSB35886.1 hypothetical protein OG949_25595 [Streptomyces scopuliridis]WSC00197.1 hypothetical protein OG835_26480 [Streptomyces scopuliridis]WSC06193.1 hypothetical protein OIE62_14915 [Streptomyces scopuliridis]
MRRARPGAVPRGTGGSAHARRAAGEERALTSVEAGDDFDDEQQREVVSRTDARAESRALSKLWHITLSVSGAEAPLPEVRRGLEQLAHDHPFLLTSRYANDHAEIRYWEEARDLHDAAAVALRLWGEHRSSAKLPPWKIVGLEVIDRETYHQRIAEGYGPPPAAPVGVHPF